MYHVLIQCCFSGLIAECYPDDTPLPPADGVMLLDANWGNAAMQLFSLDPAVVSEDDGMHLDPAYNLFEEANGFKKEGSSFSSEFIQRFQKNRASATTGFWHMPWTAGRRSKRVRGITPTTSRW